MMKTPFESRVFTRLVLQDAREGFNEALSIPYSAPNAVIIA